MLIGTPQYMSPEQARDEPLDYRTDLFSLGSVLYEACTGRAPLTAATSYGVLRRVVEHRSPSVCQLSPAAPDWLGRVIARLMEKDRGARFAAAAGMEALLRQCLAHVEQPQLVPLPAAVPRPRAGSVRAFLRRPTTRPRHPSGRATTGSRSSAPPT